MHGVTLSIWLEGKMHRHRGTLPSPYGGLISILRRLLVEYLKTSPLTFRNAFSASSLFSFHLSRKSALRGVKLDSAVIEYQRSHMMWEQLYCNVVLVVGSGFSAPKKGSASCRFTVPHSATTHHSPNHPPVLGRKFYLLSSESGSPGWQYNNPYFCILYYSSRRQCILC
jgi:hypothetical protein